MAYASWSVVFGEQPSAAKWNILGTNDASFNDGTGIAVSAITPEKLLTGTGTAWGYTSYTPALTNITIGNGTLTSYYKQIGKSVHYYGKFVMGSTSAMGTAPRIAVPITVSSNFTVASNSYSAGSCYLEDSGVSGYLAWPNFSSSSSTTFTIATLAASGSFVQTSSISSTSPFTWTSTDYLTWNIMYEAA